MNKLESLHSVSSYVEIRLMILEKTFESSRFNFIFISIWKKTWPFPWSNLNLSLKNNLIGGTWPCDFVEKNEHFEQMNRQTDDAVDQRAHSNFQLRWANRNWEMVIMAFNNWLLYCRGSDIPNIFLKIGQQEQ